MACCFSLVPAAWKGSLAFIRLGVAISSCFFIGLQPAKAGEISWRVENNFRLLSNVNDQEWIKNIAIQSRFPGSANFSINDIANRWKEVPSTPYNSELGTYDPEYINPTKWQIRLSFSSAPLGSHCEWQVASVRYNSPCHDFVPKDPVGTGPTNVEVIGPLGLTASTQIVIRDVLFAALGDSWISGEGNPDVFQDGQRRKRQWWDEKCHRSLYAWPVLAAARYAADHTQQSVTIVSRACSGAILSDLLNIPGEEFSDNHNGEVQFRPRLGFDKKIRVAGSVKLRPQIAQLSKDLCLDQWQDLEGGKGEGVCKGKQRKPDYIFLSIGGNDAKFAPLIINAMALRINEGIELKDRRKRRETLFARLLKPLLVFAKSEIEDYKNEAAVTVRYLEKQYPQMAEQLTRSFQGVPVLMPLYPDPLHGEPTTLCGRDEKQELWIRDDGIPTVDFTMHGVEDALANLLKRRITNEEVVAIHDDFYLRFVGREPLPLPDNDPERRKKREERNHDYRGLLSIGRKMESQYPGLWRVVQTSRYYPAGESPRDYALVERDQKDVDQLPGFSIRGYCVSGVTATGRWFNTVSDSIDRQGEMAGAMHPNIFGQLYYTSKIYEQIAEQGQSKALTSFEQSHTCPSGANLIKDKNVLEYYSSEDQARKMDLISLKNDAKAAYSELESLLPAKKDAVKKFEISQRDRSGRARHTPFEPASDRSAWGTSQWGRRAALEFPEVASYNEALGIWRAKMARYEAAYIRSMEADQLVGKMHVGCK